MSPTFRSLRNPNYRLWVAGALVSNTGTWMQRVAQDWLVLTELTRESGVALGVTTGLQFAPMLLLAPWAGTIADRYDRRKVLLTTQWLSGLLGLILGALVITEVAQLWHVYVLAGLLGIVSAVDNPARQVFVSELVAPEDLPNAVGLNSASFHAGRLIGPAVAGVLIHWFGTGPVFLINGLTFGAVVVSLLRMRESDMRRVPRTGRGKGAVRAGLGYVRRRPDIVLVMAIVGMVGTFGMNFQITTALMARLAFDKGSGEYGLLGSIMAIGSLGGALLAARRERPNLRLVIGATLAFGVFSTVAALMPTYWLFAVALIPVGLSSLTLMTAANATVQLMTAPSMRGRVMALYMAIFMGGTPIGAPLIGWVGETFGARWTILLGGIVTTVTALVAALWVQRSRQVRVRIRWSRRPRLVVVSSIALVDEKAAGVTASLSAAENAATETIGTQATGAQITGARSTGAQTTGMEVTGAEASGSEVAGAGLPGTGATHAKNTGLESTVVQATGAEPRLPAAVPRPCPAAQEREPVTGEPVTREPAVRSSASV